MEKEIDIDQATSLIDEVVPKLLSLYKSKDALTQLKFMFKSSDPQTVSHLQNHWNNKEGEFGSFYLNLDDTHQRMMLEYLGITVDPDKYYSYEERIYAQFDGVNNFDIFPFQTYFLFNFLRMANNYSVEIVKNMKRGEVLYQLFEESNLESYGNGINWAMYYQYLIDKKAEERKDILEFAYNFK